MRILTRDRVQNIYLLGPGLIVLISIPNSCYGIIFSIKYRKIYVSCSIKAHFSAYPYTRWGTESRCVWYCSSFLHQPPMCANSRWKIIKRRPFSYIRTCFFWRCLYRKAFKILPNDVCREISKIAFFRMTSVSNSSFMWRVVVEIVWPNSFSIEYVSGPKNVSVSNFFKIKTWRLNTNMQA